jgi:hypothetical protein
VGAKKGYAVDAQADSAEATKKKRPSRSRRGKNTKKSTTVVAKVEGAATWSVAKAFSSSETKSSDSEGSSATDSGDSADDDEVEVCELCNRISLIPQTSTTILPLVGAYGGISWNQMIPPQIPPVSGIWWNQIIPPPDPTRSHQIPPDPTRSYQIPPYPTNIMRLWS